MAHQPPLSPPVELQYGLHHIAQHNAMTPYQQSPYAQDFIHSQPGSAFASPALLPQPLHHQSSDPCLALGYGNGHYPALDDLGIHYDESPQPGFYAVRNGSYPGLPVSLPSTMSASCD